MQLFFVSCRLIESVAETTIKLLFYYYMKKLILFGICVWALPALCHSQSNTTQLPNGVIVHQAQGVEGVQEPKKIEPVQIRKIQDWTLPQCIDALSFVMMKLNEASSDLDRERYLNDRDQINQRINELKSAN